MKSVRLPLIVLAAMLFVFVTVLLSTSSLLPNTVATHFDAAGQPNGWMPRQGAVLVMGLTGLGLPLLLVGSAWLVRVLPARMINLPHRQYWLASERRFETFQWLRWFLLWVSCLETAFLTAIHVMIVLANRAPAGTLSSPLMYTTIAVFISGLALLSVKLFQHFKLVPR
jgi:uncharacterized membrane protein